MRKRLRKKKHVGEFQELGFELSFDIPGDLSGDDRNALLDDFITDAIEANDLQFGGGGSGATWSGFAVLDRQRGSTTEDQRQAVLKWLEDHPNVSNIMVGELVDAWY